ncbi:hypothetical protein C7445_105121 [Alicyclobacillus sacchari]|uniref:Uncharacterized protein n=1 Tax=Alicyclobacillus sacchari TaxID=392010 RepID=A0A4R8LNT9_9BACL|nr:hypothetical protein C7445_105121 [Alicyclobacillus sacchari]
MLNIGMLFRWGSVIMNMVQDPNIHLLARGAWTGIRKLRGSVDPAVPPRAMSGTPNTSGTQGLPYGLGNPPISDRMSNWGSSGGAIIGPKSPIETRPNEADIGRMLQDPRVQRFLRENPQMRRVIEETYKRPKKGQREGKLMPKLFSKPRRAESPDERLDGQFPFPWMQHTPTLPGNRRRQADSPLRGRRL